MLTFSNVINIMLITSTNYFLGLVTNALLIRGEGMKIKNLEVYEKCLIVVDMVNGFVREGVLHDEAIAKTIPSQIKLIREYQKVGELVVFIKDSHDEEAVEFRRFGNTKHCLAESHESELVDELKEFENQDNTISIKKNSTSFMEAEEFRSLVSSLKGLKEVEMVGCCTDICVCNGAIALANYFDQHNRDVSITVIEDGVETYDSPTHNREEYSKAAKVLMKQQGINFK